MIPLSLKVSLAALLIALLGVMACGSEDLPVEEDPVVTLTQELEILRVELASAQTNLTSAQEALRDRFSLGEASLQDNLSTVESSLTRAQANRLAQVINVYAGKVRNANMSRGTRVRVGGRSSGVKNRG